MGEHDIKPTCLSAQLHDPEDIRDPVLHYFGCIEICERKDYFNKDKPMWKYEEEIELEKIGLFHPDLKEDRRRTEAKRRVDKKIGSLAVAVEAQYKRIDILKRAIVADASRPADRKPNLDDTQKQPAPSNLVDCVAQSHEAWKGSDNFKDGIERVRQWRRNLGKPVDQPEAPQRTRSPTGPDIPEERKAIRKIVLRHQKLDADWFDHPDHADHDYSLERDVNAYVVQFERTSPEEEELELPSQSDPGPASKPQFSREPSLASTKTGTSLTYLKPVDEPQNDWRFKGQFPDQRVAMKYLLTKEKEALPDDVILWGERNPERLRYFHIPCNNMEVRALFNYIIDIIESLLTDVHCTSGLRKSLRDTSKKIDLTIMDCSETHRSRSEAEATWFLDQNSGEDSNMEDGAPLYTHGTYAHFAKRSHLVSVALFNCDLTLIHQDILEVEQNPKNLVLFMPYLHWETDRNREKMAQVIDAETEKHRIEVRKRNSTATQERISKRAAPKRSAGPTTESPTDDKGQDHKKKHQGPLRTMTEVINAMRKRHHAKDNKGLAFDANGRMLVPHNPLGQFLIDAARLYEAIATFRDKRLLENFLHKDPPYHPRRTLDQSYYWTLKTTKARDRDQVVYRSTTLDTELAHRLEELRPKKNKSLLEKIESKIKWEWWRKPESTTEKPMILHWPDHTCEDVHGCDQCKSDIRKVSRLVMVDQLWMWVLDERTIITCFPRRYGTNKQDPSGVHKSIRNRLRAARKNQIRSVFDLALIILDECSNTFFDRTKTQDRHPQVMDLFAEAIGNVTNRQTISFQHLWHWTEKACKIYRAKTEHVESNDLHVPLLDINPEGRLQREIKDIIDELDIMIHVNRKQKEVLKRFSKHVEHILDPEGHWRERSSNHDWETDGLRPPMPTLSKKIDDHTDEHEKREQFDWFRIQAFDLLSEVTDRIDELEGLKKSAESTAQSVNDLLALKQQQASVVQAWQSVKQAKETVRQGRAIMMFTIVTIVFLPLSFMSSVFGMNNSNFGDKWTLYDQFKLMFPISAGIIIAAVVLAFSNFLRALIWSAYMYLSTIFIVHTGLYRVWLTGRDEWNSQSLMRKTEEKVRKMKEEVRKQKRQRAAKRREAEAEAQEEHGEGGREKRKLWKTRRRKTKRKHGVDDDLEANGSPLPQTSPTAAPNPGTTGRRTSNALQGHAVQNPIELQPMSKSRSRGGARSKRTS